MSIICSCVVFGDDDYFKKKRPRQPYNTDDADRPIKNLEFFFEKEAFPISIIDDNKYIRKIKELFN